MGKRNKVRWGHIEELVPGEKHRIWWEGGVKPNGKRYQPSRTIYGTWEDAERELAIIYLQQGGKVPDMTYDELWGGIVVPSFEKHGLAVRTREENTRVYVRELKPRIGSKVVAGTTPKFVEDILAEIESPWVQRSTFALWRKMVNLAKHEGLQMDNPCDRYVVRKRAVPVERRLLQVEEIPGWMEAIKGFAGECALLIEAGGGPRVEEACALVGEDIAPYEKRGRLYALVSIQRALVTAKGGRLLKALKTENRFALRTIAIGEPFSPRLLEIVPKRGPICPSGVAFEAGCYEERHFKRPDDITARYKALCERKGIAYVNPGKLRKTWSTWQGEAGSEDSLVELQMGHSDGTTRGKNYQKLTRRGTLSLADALTDLIEEEMV